MLAGQGGYQHLGAIRFSWVWDAVAGVEVSLMEFSSENWETGGGQSWVWWVRHQHQPGLCCIVLEDLSRWCLQEGCWWPQAPEPVPWASWELEHPVDFVCELKCIKHQQLLTGGSQGSAHGRRGELLQCGFAKHTSCAARRAGGPGAQGTTAGTALAQRPPQTAFVERWEKSAPGLSAWCCHLVQTPHHSYAVSEVYFFTFILWDGWGIWMSGLLAWASEFSGKT